MVGAPSRHCERRRHDAVATSSSQTVGAGVPRSRRRNTAAVLLCLVGGLVPGGEAMAKNDEMDSSTTLGLLAQACASSHCGAGVDALDLWLSLEERCDVESTPSLTPTLWASGGAGGISIGGGAGEEDHWSVAYTAVICACVWTVLVYAGFRSGLWVGKKTKGRYPVV